CIEIAPEASGPQTLRVSVRKNPGDTDPKVYMGVPRALAAFSAFIAALLGTGKDLGAGGLIAPVWASQVLPSPVPGGGNGQPLTSLIGVMSRRDASLLFS